MKINPDRTILKAECCATCMYNVEDNELCRDFDIPYAHVTNLPNPIKTEEIYLPNMRNQNMRENINR